MNEVPATRVLMLIPLRSDVAVPVGPETPLALVDNALNDALWAAATDQVTPRETLADRVYDLVDLFLALAEQRRLVPIDGGVVDLVVIPPDSIQRTSSLAGYSRDVELLADCLTAMTLQTHTIRRKLDAPDERASGAIQTHLTGIETAISRLTTLLPRISRAIGP